MSEPILHHYPASPFAEKSRLMLGLKRLAWASVTIPMVMPKPELVALTGGYRRTPVPVSYTHLRAHETKANLVCRLLL